MSVSCCDKLCMVQQNKNSQMPFEPVLKPVQRKMSRDISSDKKINKVIAINEASKAKVVQVASEQIVNPKLKEPNMRLRHYRPDSA